MYVADDSVYPIVPVGNTAYPAFLVGNLIVKQLYEKYDCGCGCEYETFASDKTETKNYVKSTLPAAFADKKLNCYLNTGCTRDNRQINPNAPWRLCIKNNRKYNKNKKFIHNYE